MSKKSKGEIEAFVKVKHGINRNNIVKPHNGQIFDENGNLIRLKKTTGQLNEGFAKKNPIKAKEIVPLEPAQAKYSKFADVSYIQNQTQRNALIQLIDEVQKIDELTVTQDSAGCLCGHLGKFRVFKAIPYKKIWSFEQANGITIRPTVEDAIRIIKETMQSIRSKKSINKVEGQ